MKHVYILLFALMVISTSANAQCDQCPSGKDGSWCWGPDPGAAKERNALYSDSYKLKHYQDALAPLEWLLQNTPYLNKSIYINGAKVYEGLAEAETDAVKRKAYENKVIETNYQRIKYFCEEDKVMQSIGLKAYNYWKDDPERKGGLFELYKKIFEINGKNTSRPNITFYMVTAVNARIGGVITPDQGLEIYDKVTEVLDENVDNSTGDEKELWIKTQNTVDGYLIKLYPNLDCEFVKTKMGPSLESSPEDMKLQKRALKYLIMNKCFDEAMFLKVAINIFAKEPTKGLAKTIAGLYIKLGDYSSALDWTKKAAEQAKEDPAEQAKLTLETASLLAKLKRKVEARSQAIKAVDLDPSIAADAYSFIGDLYMTSGDDCVDPSAVNARTIYLAAYDMYQKAGNSEKMGRARAQFPSVSDIFERNLTEGASIDVICWIGGKTTIRTRPKDGN